MVDIYIILMYTADMDLHRNIIKIASSFSCTYYVMDTLISKWLNIIDFNVVLLELVEANVKDVNKFILLIQIKPDRTVGKRASPC